jgi:hypothetical protein
MQQTLELAAATPLNVAITLAFLLGSATALGTSAIYGCFLSASEAPN